MLREITEHRKSLLASVPGIRQIKHGRFAGGKRRCSEVSFVNDVTFKLAGSYTDASASKAASDLYASYIDLGVLGRRGG